MLRALYNVSFFLAWIVFGSYSIWLGLSPSNHILPFTAENFGIERKELIKIISIFWLIVPPILLWFDWTVFCRNFDLINLEITRHSHGLVRNIWLGFIGVVVIIFGTGTILSP